MLLNKEQLYDMYIQDKITRKKEQIAKQKRLDNELKSFEMEGRESARRSHYYRGVIGR